MARLRITVDYMDGRTRVLGPLDPGDIDTWGMLMKLSEAEIASITFTRADPLTYLVKDSKRKEGA